MGIPMGEKVKSFGEPIYIRETGLFDFEGLYQFMWNWLVQRRWRVHEKQYSDKSRTALGNEIKCKWESDRKATEFIKFFMSTYIHIWTGKEILIEQDGVKKKMMKGRIQIEFKSWIVFDYHSMFKGNAMIKWFGKVIGWLRQREFERDYIDSLQYETYRFNTHVKKFLNMEAPESAWD